MSDRLSNKIAVVTGSGKGIGRAIAERFARAGASVVVCDVDEASAKAVADAINAAGGAAIGLRVDVADKISVEALAAASLSHFGRIDIVVNNAGVLDGFVPLGDASDEHWNRIIGINLTGCFLVSRAFLPGMLERGAGTFVNLASIAGLVAQAGGLAYTTAKHGIIGFTKQVSADYGSAGIRANAICPGAIATDLSKSFLDNAPEVLAVVESVPAGRQGRAEEIADLALYLASDESSFVYGAAMVIDGGWTIR